MCFTLLQTVGNYIYSLLLRQFYISGCSFAAEHPNVPTAPRTVTQKTLVNSIKKAGICWLIKIQKKGLLEARTGISRHWTRERYWDSFYMWITLQDRSYIFVQNRVFVSPSIRCFHSSCSKDFAHISLPLSFTKPHQSPN